MKKSAKPPWLRVRIPAGAGNDKVLNVLAKYGLNTVCQDALCPNMGECFSKKVATFMILGDVCTRNCRYCGVSTGKPSVVDLLEPEHIADAVAELGLRHAVITSVTRDDLDDGGASVFQAVIKKIREKCPDVSIEVLVPDFSGIAENINIVTDAAPDVFAHNLEVAKRLFSIARPQGDYKRSLNVLRLAREKCVTKSGFMIGLGETDAEIIETMKDLSEVTDILTIGQYLQPTIEHLDVMKYYEPEEFDKFREIGLEQGFRHVESGPLVRSSYHAGEYFNQG